MSDQSIHDLSNRAVSMAREIDRLPDGCYSIELVKPELPGLSWTVRIVRTERVRDMELPRREVRLEP